MRRKIATCDCETDPFLHGRVPEPFIWGFYDGTEYKQFTNTADFAEYIKTFKGVLYAHNGGKFDYHFLLDYINPDKPLMIINGRLSKFYIGECECRDSYNILPVPLKAYQKDDFQYEWLEKDVRQKYMPKIEAYLKSDCVFLHEFITRAINDYGLNLTLASSAFKVWRTKFAKIKTPKSTKGYFKQFKPFYYGGRVECFKKGVINKPFASWDINSAYPHAMQHNHAFGYEHTVSDTLPADKNELQRAFLVVEGVARGCFPHRTKSGLSFPHDTEKRLYTITGWEYVAGIENNAFDLHKVHTVYTFTDKINFGDYVGHFYDQKAECKGTDKAGYLLAKLYLNSLYGKFGQSGEKHVNYQVAEPDKAAMLLDKTELDLYGELGRYALLGTGVPEEEQTFYNVATAASITGFVRAFMFNHLCKAKGLIYCDTDSIVAEELPCQTGELLGQWEKEGTYSEGAIGGKKLYALKKTQGGYKISCKGVRISEKDIYKVAKGGKVLYRNEAPSFSVSSKPHFITREVRLT